MPVIGLAQYIRSSFFVPLLSEYTMPKSPR